MWATAAGGSVLLLLNFIISIFVFLGCTPTVNDKVDASTSLVNDSAQTMDCYQMGEIGVFMGPPGQEKPLKQCCKGLKFVETKRTCLDRGGLPSSYGGTPVLLCAACGDGICNEKFEANCNCPKDCK